MDKNNYMKFVMGSGGVNMISLATLTFNDISTNDVIDIDTDFKISDVEARTGAIDAGKTYSNVSAVEILPDCTEVGLQAFRNYSIYDWNPVGGVSFKE